MLGPLEDIITNSSHLTQRDREELSLIQRNSLRLLKLVNTLLDFSRIEAGIKNSHVFPDHARSRASKISINGSG
jgi:signal transduction histidine kinase